jgi:hypothetical protein
MKGIELPINILVIVAVAIIVLLGVVALFYSSWFTGTAPVSLEAAKSQACNSMSRAGCSVLASSITITYGTATDLQGLCRDYYNVADLSPGNPDDVGCKNRVCGMNCA